MNKEQIIQQLKAIKPILQERYGVNELALFGSCSRNEATPGSDIDLLIGFEKPSAHSLFSSFDLLQECFADIPVQIVSKGAIKPHYLKAIRGDLIYA
ncbi:MAG: nucleotidyltransferase family protein [Chitinophagaceae bacterium]|nr:nucleotidyltransferase family protein [Chitinophagaceae bacterium]